MKTIRPSKEEVLSLAAGQDYTCLPVSLTLLSDFITPIEALRILKGVSDHTYLFESVSGNEQRGRYTFLGYDPGLQVSSVNGVLEIGGEIVPDEDPLSALRRILAGYKSPRFDHLPPFTGGMVGYFSFEFLRLFEPSIDTPLTDEEGFKDLDLMLFDRVIAFDHWTQKITLICNMSLSEPEKSYEEAVGRLYEMEALLKSGKRAAPGTGRITGEITPLFSKEAYMEMVEKARQYIYEGDIFQIVLSNRFTAPFEGSLLEPYRILRTINPSPYMFYLSGTDVEIAGASPETLVKCQDGLLKTFPLAGTRPRGRTPAEDQALRKELLSDEKELAEHNMLVDLGRNDLGRVSEFGSVEVESLRQILSFSHVMHIGSTVKGRIRPDRDALDAIGAVLPAGTLSGAPKIRACQLIGELEGVKRGIYGGAIGYIDLAGNLDTCIAIRLLFKKNGRVFIQSGAGIVADSVPEKEYEECLNKARAARLALEMAKEVL